MDTRCRHSRYSSTALARSTVRSVPPRGRGCVKTQHLILPNLLGWGSARVIMHGTILMVFKSDPHMCVSMSADSADSGHARSKGCLIGTGSGETIKMVAGHFRVPVNHNLKVEENERLSFHTASVAGGSALTITQYANDARPTRYHVVVLTS